MLENRDVSSFISRCEQWLCDDYSLDVRYIATVTPAGRSLFDAALLLNPLPSVADDSLALSLPQFSAGREQVASVSKEKLLASIRSAVAGALTVHDQTLALPTEGTFSYQPAVSNRNTWFMPLTLQIYGAACGAPIDLDSQDTELRAAAPPFDGAEDLRAWLGLRWPTSGSLSGISLAVNPPVDIIISQSRLSDGVLHLVLHAHPKADRSHVRVAVCEIPGQGLRGRIQVGDRIVWGRVSEGRLEGTADVALPEASGALVMLLIGSATVRRQWFVDPARAPNTRFAAIQRFDTGLRMIKRALFEDSDSGRFETAVAALLFLLGFAPSVQLETDSPDLIVATPAGRVIVAECTTRVADVATKVGKLVDRREALQRKLREDGAGAEITAALVCRLPRDQIAAHVDYIKSMRIVLVSAEDITEGLVQVQFPMSPDDILTQAARTFGA